MTVPEGPCKVCPSLVGIVLHMGGEGAHSSIFNLQGRNQVQIGFEVNF